MNEYKVGDRVIGINKRVRGFDIEGTIIEHHNDASFCVEFDEYIGGHSCQGAGKKDHCWWVNGGKDVIKIAHKKRAPKKIATSKIVITTDGKETLARIFEDGKAVRSATAKCSPEDAFDFFVGARLAFERLVESTPKEKEYYNGKVVCVKSGYPWWTVGKVYEVVDGRITADDGDIYPCRRGGSFEPYKDAEDVRHAGRINGKKYNLENEFIPLVE